ncbi:MAG: 2-amino-4-hydroxy-6-hydroxymethyldihydropteridine diphosphokinase [Parvibaculum sp.]|uniref:2-amino-4-hydroxy-6- hydroxymethyldihydropteridine diphosphokinase n=1 Tax=Parvibaculum sp. TaxID=2024848 RepID=UPI002850AFDA|nr:2-amino-4-hydroxy-6-hydroxymethyldihydropteridine diphosphokinase [Parvibaculum sp.]MDR3499959.1 2-amino-4-hydroxy-6-hydroxymethyldihydropteridine diphosphokinase [Parvibaculum sp.]
MILIGMGANLPTVHGGPMATLEAAMTLMPALGISIVRRSAFYLTPPLTPYAQPDFVNNVVMVETALPAASLLDALHRIEDRFGRHRTARWAARTLDLDLLDYQGQIVHASGPRGVEAGPGVLPLALPHPGIAGRAFVLVPLAEVAPEWRDPVSGETAGRLLQRLVAAQGPAAMAGIRRIGLKTRAKPPH